MKSYEAPFIENSYVFLKKREISFINKDNWTELFMYTELNHLNSNLQKEISSRITRE